MATKYSPTQVATASDHCITELVKAIRFGKRFRPAEVIEGWAKESGIADEDRRFFVAEAMAMFRVEATVRGLTEFAGLSQQTDESEEAARSRRMLSSPVYSLYEPEGGWEHDPVTGLSRPKYSR